MERWRKWRFALSGADEAAAVLGDSPAWVAVSKERAIRTYRVTPEGTVREVFNSEGLEQGCSWEVAQVRVEESAEMWWSIGFEAFGPQNQLEEPLLQVARHILAAEGAPALGVEDYFAYPRWLQLVGQSD